MDDRTLWLSEELELAAQRGEAGPLRALADARRRKGDPAEAALADSLALLCEGDIQGAKDLLRKATAEHPAWFLASHLAAMISESEGVAESLVWLERALKAKGAPRVPLLIDLAAANLEAGHFERVLAIYEDEPHIATEPESIALRLQALVELGRFDEVRILSETARAELVLTKSPEELQELGEVFAVIEMARAFAAQDADQKGEARDAALEALSWSRGHEDALAMLRDLGPGPHPEARAYRVQATLEVPMEEDGELQPELFRCDYVVATRNAGDLPALLAAVEPPDYATAIQIDEVEDLGPAPELAVGVLAQGELIPKTGDESSEDRVSLPEAEWREALAMAEAFEAADGGPEEAWSESSELEDEEWEEIPGSPIIEPKRPLSDPRMMPRAFAARDEISAAEDDLSEDLDAEDEDFAPGDDFDGEEDREDRFDDEFERWASTPVGQPVPKGPRGKATTPPEKRRTEPAKTSSKEARRPQRPEAGDRRAAPVVDRGTKRPAPMARPGRGPSPEPVEEYRFPGLDEEPERTPAAPPVRLRSIPLPPPESEEDARQGEPGFRLQAFLKWQGAVGTGGEAKMRIQGGEVKVNGEIETRRGRRLRPGDRIELAGQTLIVPQE